MVSWIPSIPIPSKMRCSLLTISYTLWVAVASVWNRTILLFRGWVEWIDYCTSLSEEVGIEPVSCSTNALSRHTATQNVQDLFCRVWWDSNPNLHVVDCFPFLCIAYIPSQSQRSTVELPTPWHGMVGVEPTFSETSPYSLSVSPVDPIPSLSVDPFGCQSGKREVYN